MKVVVLGAGVIGVTSAYFLARDGHEVTVIEKESRSAMSCSYANGGQLSYSHIQTWASQISFWSLFKSLFGAKSPIIIQDFNKQSLKWAIEVYRNSFAEVSRRNSENLWTLSRYSKEGLRYILEQENTLKFSHSKKGNLHFYRNQKLFEKAIVEAEFHDYVGCKSKVLSAQECVDFEPYLSKLFEAEKLVGGILYMADESGDCAAFTNSLAEICQKKYGVDFHYGVEIKNILTNYEKITGVHTSKKVFAADAYVYALGAGGDSLLKGIKIDSKVYPLKGYSLSIPCEDTDFVAPKISATDNENKMVYSRIGDVFRVAGGVEMSGFSGKKNHKLSNFLDVKMRETFLEFGEAEQAVEWSGFRPFRPNSIPLVCRVKKYGNLLLNVGHGALGWTLAAGSGKIISDLVSTNRLDKSFQFLEKEAEEL
jgi:D-amino-acid dehydrogenase